MKIILILLIVVVLVGIWLFLQNGSKSNELNDPTVTTEGTVMEEKTENQETENQEVELPEKLKANILTNRGNIVLEIYPRVAPLTVFNFVKLSTEGFYNETKFHRVIPEFMIQGGDPLSKDADPSNDGTGGPGYAFKDEINPKTLGLTEGQIAQLEAIGYEYNLELESIPVEVGTIAMANSGPNTNGSQFFIVTVQNQPHLNGRHTVFGRVIEGMDIVTSTEQGDTVKTITITSF